MIKSFKSRNGPVSHSIHPESMSMFLSAIREGNNYKTAAEYAGIADHKFCVRLMDRGNGVLLDDDEYSDFVRDVRSAEAESEIRIVRRLNRAAEEGEWKIDVWILERRWPSKWGKHIEVNNVGNGNKPTRNTLEQLRSLTVSELEMLEAVTKKLDGPGSDDDEQ